jgi:CHAT domain-containing protein
MFTYRDLERLRDPRRPAWATLAALGERLLPAWLRPRLGPDHRLLIVPGAPLHAIAWATLRVDEAWLCEHAVIQILPALGLPSPPDAPADQGRALLLGCEAFGDRAAPLPGAVASLDLVAQHWDGPADRLVGPAASRSALLALSQSGALQRYRLLHIASHAQLGPAGGLLAHIKLADDDILLDELLQLQIRAALVVLAACEGGAAEALPGDEVLGLASALIAAGARAVLASLWPIYDGGTLATLAPFYAALTGGDDAALALARSQRAMIAAILDDDQSDSLVKTPFIWGGFTVTTGLYAPQL